MRRPRITVGGVMCVVIGFGVALDLTLATIRVSSAKEYHSHTWVHVKAGKPFTTLAVAEQPPFWPRYWRCLLGRPWKSLPLCPQVKGRLLDMCEFAHPEICKPVGGERHEIHPTQSQIDLERRLRNQSR